jgi:hypothetical protein
MKKSYLFWLAFIVNIITWLFIYFKIKPASEVIPLHYNIFYGADFAGKAYFIYFMPAIGLAILLVNYFFYKKSEKFEKFAGQLLLAVSLFVQLMVLIAIFFLKSSIVI